MGGVLRCEFTQYRTVHAFPWLFIVRVTTVFTHLGVLDIPQVSFTE